MGRGSYLGGSTIIYPGGWGFSRLDPVLIKKNKASSMEPSNALVKAKGPKMPPPKIQPKGKDWWAEFLSAVIAAEVYGTPAPSLSKQAPILLHEEVKTYATAVHWARAKKEYSELKERFATRKKNRNAKKHNVPLRKASALVKEVATFSKARKEASTPVATQVADIADAISFHERKLKELKAEYKVLIEQLLK